MEKGLVPRGDGRFEIALRELPSSCQREWLHLHEVPWKRRLGKANKQIKAAKSILRIPDACGLLFIADDAPHSFAPQDVMTFIARILRSEKKDHSQIYSSIDRVIYFSVNPRIASEDGRGINFWLPVYRGENEQPISHFLDDLKQRWIRYHADLLGLTLVPGVAEKQPPITAWMDESHGLRRRP